MLFAWGFIDGVVTAPTWITGELVWSGWSGYIIKDHDGLRFNNIEPLEGPVEAIVGFDRPVAVHLPDGRVRDLMGETSTTHWNTIVVTGLDNIYAAHDFGLYFLSSFTDVGKALSHPALRYPVTLYAMESRAFALYSGSMSLLFEIIAEDRGRIIEPRLELVEGLEGFGIVSVTSGPCNRLGIVTDTGDAYILEKRSLEPELLAENVRLLGLGSDFEVVVNSDTVLTRGNNDLGQLGREGSSDWSPICMQADRVRAVRCSRWGTIMTVDAEHRTL